MLFIDFSSAFNLLDPNTSLCSWILELLTGRLQSVRIRHSISKIITLSTGAVQGDTQLTQDCIYILDHGFSICLKSMKIVALNGFTFYCMI